MNKAGIMRGLVEKSIAWADIMAAQGLKDRPEEYAPYFELEESKGREQITDLQTVMERMTARNVPLEGFLKCLTARKADSETSGPGLEGELRRATGLKGKPLKQELNQVLEGCTTEGTTKLVPVVKESYKALTQ